MKKDNSIAVGIPTFQLGESLVSVLKSVYRQTCYKNISEILVVVDGRKNFNQETLKRIKNKKLKVLIFDRRKGQSARMNDIFRNSKSDLLILTNDDVILEVDAVEKIYEKFIKEEADLICAKSVPLSPASFFEQCLAIGNNINYLIASTWNKGDNYLSCNGRLLGLSKRLYRKLKVPEKTWNSDAFLYLFSKVNNFKVVICFGAAVFYKLPENLKEHLNQSVKFQSSKMDNQRYFKRDISNYYEVPRKYKLKSLFRYLFRKPIYALGYVILFQISRFKGFGHFLPGEKNYWEIDESTKNLKFFSSRLFKVFAFIGLIYYNTYSFEILGLIKKIIG